MLNVSLRPDDINNYPGRTYRHYKGTPVFEFGHGLSYTAFKYSAIGKSDYSIKYSDIKLAVEKANNNSNLLRTEKDGSTL
jgi:hypothetical protein